MATSRPRNPTIAQELFWASLESEADVKLAKAQGCASQQALDEAKKKQEEWTQQVSQIQRNEEQRQQESRNQGPLRALARQEARRREEQARIKKRAFAEEVVESTDYGDGQKVVQIDESTWKTVEGPYYCKLCEAHLQHYNLEAHLMKEEHKRKVTLRLGHGSFNGYDRAPLPPIRESPAEVSAASASSTSAAPSTHSRPPSTPSPVALSPPPRGAQMRAPQAVLSCVPAAPPATGAVSSSQPPVMMRGVAPPSRSVPTAPARSEQQTSCLRPVELPRCPEQGSDGVAASSSQPPAMMPGGAPPSRSVATAPARTEQQTSCLRPAELARWQEQGPDGVVRCIPCRKVCDDAHVTSSEHLRRLGWFLGQEHGQKNGYAPPELEHQAWMPTSSSDDPTSERWLKCLLCNKWINDEWSHSGTPMNPTGSKEHQKNLRNWTRTQWYEDNVLAVRERWHPSDGSMPRPRRAPATPCFQAPLLAAPQSAAPQLAAPQPAASLAARCQPGPVPFEPSPVHVQREPGMQLRAAGPEDEGEIEEC